MNLTKACKFTRLLNGVGAGTNDVQTTTAVDMANFDSVVLAVAVGTITSSGTCAIQVRQDSAIGLGSSTASTGATHTLTDADSNKVVLIEVERPTKQYVFATLTRATANVVIDGVIAIQSAPRVKPVTNPATVDTAVIVVSPAEV